MVECNQKGRGVSLLFGCSTFWPKLNKHGSQRLNLSDLLLTFGCWCLLFIEES